MRWRPVEERPETDEIITGLIATFDADGEAEYFLMGLYLWRDGGWINEEDGKPLKPGRYWWVPEVEVIRDLSRSGVTA